MYDRTQHSVFRIEYHVVFVTKYRAKIISEEIRDFLKKEAIRLGEGLHLTVEEFNSDIDHVHMLVRVKDVRYSNITSFITAFKMSTAKSLKKMYPNISEQLYKGSVWSRGTFIDTIGGNSENIKKYIRNQNKDNKTKDKMGRFRSKREKI